eukprot:CAMPEP_0174238364 /NCGR_PEP_ID=MMETSP0417-20130205/11151_1 /TAXON_ID=242541 /ORGANISM="Mayorella sp, Strain BSH-02190019" /LENGTH=179 /DNA_ID=CAMNT_0015317195 /DNA_START=65 /DNA_END=604 /DNA_ORIENTATION=-
MCSMVVQYVMDRDPEAKFSFASLQSRAAAPLLVHFGIPANLDTVVYIQHGQAFTHSEAVLRACAQLSGCSAQFFAVFICVPTTVRDFGYRFVASSRYSVFGRSATCRVPSRSTRARFLDWGEFTVASAASSAPSASASSASTAPSASGSPSSTSSSSSVIISPAEQASCVSSSNMAKDD